MGMTCNDCKCRSETWYNNDGISSVEYCPICGVELRECPPVYDEEEEDDEIT